MEFNKNTPHGEPGPYPEHTAYTPQSFYNRNEYKPTTPKIMLVGKFYHSFVDKNIQHYLRAEGFEVIEVNFVGAFEQIRWEQPALVMFESSDSGCNLMFRLQADHLTQHIGIIIVGQETDRQTNSPKCNVVGVKDFRELTQAIERLRPFPDALPSNLFQISKVLNDLELHFFTEQIVDSLETLQVAGWFAQNLEATANIENLVDVFDMHPLSANNAIYKLAWAGFIEPLDIETPDPLFGVVAHPEKIALLQKFGWALAFKTYRTALVTWLLAHTLR